MKKFLLRTGLFILLALAVNVSVQYVMMIDRESDLFDVKSKLQNNPHVILFGSSVNVHYDKNDTNKTQIGEYVNAMTPGIEITDDWRLSASLETYANHLRFLKNENIRPKLLVVPLNLRSFSPEWNLRPEYRAYLAREDIFLNKGIIQYIFRKILPAGNDTAFQISKDDFYNTELIVDNKKAGQVKDYIVEDKKNITDMQSYVKDGFLVNYMTDIDDSNYKLNALKEIISYCKEEKVSVIFYYTPIDYQRGEKFYPILFSKQIEKNVSLINKNIPENDLFKVVDLSRSLNSDKFSYDGWPNEHMKHDGRYFVSDTIAKEINLFMSIR